MGHNLPPEPLEIELSDIEELTQSVYALKRRNPNRRLTKVMPNPRQS